MRILLAHNTYKQAGGEDAVFRHERALLEQHGHEVTVYTRDNAEIEPTSIGDRIDLAQDDLEPADSRRTVTLDSGGEAGDRALYECVPPHLAGSI